MSATNRRNGDRGELRAIGPRGRRSLRLLSSRRRQDDRADTPTAPSRWCVFIGDIEGHGLAAAMVMAIVQAVLHVHPSGIATPAGLLMYGNRQLCSSRISGLVTAFLGIYEPASRRLTYARAGHPPPLLRRAADGSILALDAVAATRLESMNQRLSKKPPCSLNEATPFCFTPMESPRRRATAQDQFGS